ncbi:Nn.00g082330.m01.CDS01 [Neocucurbitaria sp. VM-36]
MSASVLVRTAPKDAGSDAIVETNSAETGRWPLGYCLQPPRNKQQSLQEYGFESHRPPPKRWWSHGLYRGPQNQEVQILYSRTKAQSEVIARRFLGEPVVGFDMEWPWNDYKKNDLQNKIGLIQVAIEDKIALFHIGLHPGKTVDEIIAPSLRQLIESPTISKLGVGVLNADFSRLRKYFCLDPKGAFELSHLYRLVKFGGYKPDLVSTKLVSLARQVEDHLGHPLWKGDVRTSDWSKPLSQEQIKYAAGDAYAGYMLFHCMNYKRLQMQPVPPLPIYAENYLSYRLFGVVPLRLAASPGGVPTTTSEEFFGVEMTDSVPARSKTGVQKTQVTKPKVPEESLDNISQALYDELFRCRATLAKKATTPAYKIASNSMLNALARDRPLDTNSMLLIKGIGSVHREKFGDAWIEVISRFVAVNSLEAATRAPSKLSVNTGQDTPRKPTVHPPHTPRRSRKHGQHAEKDSTDSSPAFGTPPVRTPQLHTGLSFTMAETKIDGEGNDSEGSTRSFNSQDTLPDLDFGSPPRRTSSQLKRKRTESPTPEAIHTASPHLQHLAQLSESKPCILSATPAVKVQSIPNYEISPAQPPTEPLTLESRIARNKLMAFSKRITNKLPARPANAPPIVTQHTLDLIIRTAPRTQDDLERIPGIDSFLLACEQTGTDLLVNVIKFAPLQS